MSRKTSVTSKRQKLSSDELGAVGESMFAALATSARLVVNSSERDKKGWDFFVQAEKQGVTILLDPDLIKRV